ncbi:hypothetical protein [Oceanospirillum sediminis]|uniref:Uncharacterized protein n=1 Tax=Oceanospirillum sediminis TaxID=2760088 RepID=A0A839IV92_9GAMM|nr:hypothetical protein [Oceanospirillum sediminis]MBB1488389.1 hypothetical protein [Oceanospirillum sediminis]
MDRRQFLFSGTTAAVMASVPAMTLSQLSIASGEVGMTRLTESELSNMGLLTRNMDIVSADGGVVTVPMKAQVARRYQGQVYVWFETDQAIRVYDQSGNSLLTVSLGQSVAVQDFAVDSYGNLFVLMAGSHEVLWLDSQGAVLGSIGRFGTELPEQLNGPVSLTIDALDNLHVLNAGSRTVKVFSGSGVYLHDYGQSRWLSERRLSSVDGTSQVQVTGGDKNNSQWLFSLDGHLISGS